MLIKVDKGAFPPTRAHKTDAGLDLRAAEDYTILAKGHKTIETGVHVQLPRGTAGLLVSKSGLNVKYNLTSTGLIDEGYTGSIKVKLYNHGLHDYYVKKGDKISQLVIFKVAKPKLRVVKDLPDTERGSGGFGSTGR